LADLQGSFTFPPQQMPHASTYIRVGSLGSRAEAPLILGVRWIGSWNSWDDYGFDGGIRTENAIKIAIIFCTKLIAAIVITCDFHK
jgi:hypothetical protein